MSALAIRGSKSSGESAHTPVESPDSLINTSYAVLLDAISEGPIVGLVNGAQSIYFDQTPLANPDGSLNYSNVTWEGRTGEADQDYIAGFPAVEAETAVGVQLTFAQSWTQAISNTQLSAVRVRLGVSVLYTSESDGDTVGAVVNYAIDLSTNNGDYVTVVSQAFNGKTTNGYQRTHRIDLPASAGGWRIRVRRLTADNVSGTQAVTSIVGYTEIVDAKLQYPYTALVGTKIDASQFSSIPERAFRIRGRIIQVPTNYEPSIRGYSGTWDGTFKLAWTDNPAWIFRDLILNDRYGLGQVIKADQVDKWSLYQIAQYCDQLVDNGKGSTEPRFTCNLYLQSRANALQVLQDLASVFRGMSYYAGTEVMVSADMPSDPVYTYTNANVIDGKFSRAASSGTTRYSVCKVSWSDTENFGNVRTEYVTRQEALARYGVRETEITAFACTSQGQAQRLGQYTLLTNQLETDTISFSVGLDGTIARPGQLIRVADEFYGGKPMAGRIKSATTTTVTLDNDIEAAAGDTLVVILPTGTAETRVIQGFTGRVVTVSQAFSAVPAAQSIYSIETTELVAETYRILTVAENFGDDKLQYDVVAVQHNASKFAAIDNGAQIVTPPTSVLPNAVQAIPTNVALTTYDAVKQGVNVATMRITWDAPSGAVYYNVWWRRGASDWINAGVTYTASIEVAGIYTDTYTARVSAVGVTGNSSLWGYSPATDLQGKTGTPPAVTSLTAASQLFGIALAWTFPAGAEDTQRTEVWYGKSPSLDAAAKLSDLAYPQRDYVLQNLQAGATFYFWARLVDRIGNIGPFYPVGNGVQGIASTDAGLILDAIAGEITETQLGQDLLTKIDKIDEIDGLQEQIDNLSNPIMYKATDAYAIGAIVYQGDRLYQAIAAVPAKADGTNAPPNATYWKDVGQILTTANGLVTQVNQNTSDINAVSAQASSLQSLVAARRDDGASGALADALNSWNSIASAAQETKVRAEQDYAQSTRTTTLEAAVGDNATKITTVQQVVADNQTATAQQITQLTSTVGDNAATVTQLSKTVADNQQATATTINQLSTTVGSQGDTLGQQQTAITQTTSIVNDINGKLAATWSVKMQYITSTGQYIAAGIGLGIENTAAGLQSQFLVSADRFAVVNTIAGGTATVPFAVQGGQVFINNAIIQDLSLSFGKISDTLQSDNYVAGSQGWKLSKAGAFEINGVVAGGGRITLTNRALKVFDQNGVLRVQLGDLTA
jgi:predicted phage tail protein